MRRKYKTARGQRAQARLTSLRIQDSSPFESRTEGQPAKRRTFDWLRDREDGRPKIFRSLSHNSRKSRIGKRSREATLRPTSGGRRVTRAVFERRVDHEAKRGWGRQPLPRTPKIPPPDPAPHAIWHKAASLAGRGRFLRCHIAGVSVVNGPAGLLLVFTGRGLCF